MDLAKTSSEWTPSPAAADHGRRSVYILSRRNLRFPFLEVFDAPDSTLTCPERGRSTTAPQSLTLLNSQIVMTASTATSDRVMSQAKSDGDRIEVAFRLILGRAPNAKEHTMALEFLQSKIQTPNSKITELCRALFNLNAFIYVE